MWYFGCWVIGRSVSGVIKNGIELHLMEIIYFSYSNLCKEKKKKNPKMVVELTKWQTSVEYNSIGFWCQWKLENY